MVRGEVWSSQSPLQEYHKKIASCRKQGRRDTVSALSYHKKELRVRAPGYVCTDRTAAKETSNKKGSLRFAQESNKFGSRYCWTYSHHCRIADKNPSKDGLEISGVSYMCWIDFHNGIWGCGFLCSR